MDCELEYIGETSRELSKRIQEHKQALRNDDTLYATVQHRNQKNHRINTEDVSVIHKEDNTSRRRLIEAAIISQHNTFEQRPGFYHLAPNLAKEIVKIYKIKN